MQDPFTRLEDLPLDPPVLWASYRHEHYWLCQLVPPVVLSRESLTPYQADFSNYWLIRWGCTTRFLNLDQRDSWLDSLHIRSPLPLTQS